ncbi:MAG: DUF1735 domain-containing protein [Bacteroidales bacterium]|nr:DUF1735 domain-containing protein [Bacteroidales bacterium]
MKKISIILTSLLLLPGCFPDDRDNFMVDDSLGLSSRDVLLEASVHTGHTTLGLVKSGKGQSKAKAWINADISSAKALLDDYNQKNNTDYVALPSNFFEYSQTKFSFNEEDVSKEIVISWSPQTVSNYMETSGEGKKYVIPILVESDDETVKVRENRRWAMIHLVRSGVRISQQNGLSRDVDINRAQSGQETADFDIIVDNLDKNMSVSIPVKADNNLISKYNEGKDITYLPAPEGLVKVNSSTVNIPEGGKSGIISVTIDYSVLLENGALKEFTGYVVPITLDIDGIKAKYKGQDFELKGLHYGNTVTYVAFTWIAPIKGIYISREWGLFSTELNSWSDYMGMEENTDRNFTMDKQFIYIPETSEENANIWKIDVNNPKSVSKVKAPKTPTGHFKVTSARMIEPGTSKMNGGNPMLVVSNMVMKEDGPMLKLYIYDKGTDNEPSEWQMAETNLGRRLGDIFTTHGTFADGGFMFKDWNQTYGNGTILVWRTAFESVPNYSQTPRNPTWNTIKNEGGRAAFYPYPGQATPQKCIYTGTESAYYVTENGSNVYSWAPSVFNASAASDYYKGARDFNFFEFHGKRYIAYVKNVASNDGRLYVLEGELADNWQDILDGKRKVIFQASLQADLQFSDAEVHEELAEPSPRNSGNSGCGCAAVAVGDGILIMAGKQNVGLSLFRMIYVD